MKNNVQFYVYGIIWVIVLIVIIYFHPTSEQMVCDSVYNCKITHEYLHKFTFNENIKLGKYTILSYVVDYKRALKKIHLVYDNKKPFVFYFGTGYTKEDVIQNEIDNFNSYKINPQSNYIVKSAASPFNFYRHI